MKKEIYVHIPEPCHENWEQMTPVQQGRFCQSCCKQVVDFSQMSDKQILNVLSKESSKTCGRFSAEQLERPIVHQPASPIPYRLFLSAFIPAFLLANTDKAKAQVKGKVTTKTEAYENIVVGMILPEIRREVKITGNVKDEKGQPLASASIVVKGTQEGTITDAAGNFSLKPSTKSKKQTLQVSYVGYKTKEIEIRQNDQAPIEVRLTNADIVLQGDVVVVGQYESQEFGEEFEDFFAIDKKITYKGIVINEQGQPVAYASLKLTSNKAVSADSSGRFSFEARQNKKRIMLHASSVGYQALESTIELNGKEGDTIKVALKNNVALDEVVVKCSTAEALTGMVGGLSIVRTVRIIDTARTFVDKLFNNEMFKAYPNPVIKGSDINLTFKNAGKYSVQLFDNSGKLYVQKEISNHSASPTFFFKLPAVLSAGIYYLKAINTSTNKQYIDKLIIQ